MTDLASGYRAAFGKAFDPKGDGRPESPRLDPAEDRILNLANDGPVLTPEPFKA
jgi:hypothetical protein